MVESPLPRSPRRRGALRVRRTRRRRRPRGRAGGPANATGGLGARPHPAGRRRRLQRPGRARGAAGPRPGPGGRHRQDQARPAVERLLREGARRPVLAVLRARSVRRPLRARGDRLPRGLRPLDRAPQPRLLPRPARRASSVDVASLVSGIHPDRGRRRRLRQARATGSLRGIGFLLVLRRRPAAEPRASTRPVTPRTPDVPAPAPLASADGRRTVPGSASSAPATTPARCCCPTCATTPASSWSSVATTQVAVRGQRAAQVRVRRRSPPTSRRCWPTTRSTPSSSSPGTTRTPIWSAEALERGKAVFVEKPLALDEEQLAQVLDTVEQTGNDRLMVGFNRRFAPLFVDLRDRMGPPQRSSVGPLSGQRRPARPDQLVSE